MCTQANQDIIHNVLNEWVRQGRAFTAYEVSKEAQRQGASERHLHMRNFIHQCPVLTDAIDFGDYTKTLISVGPNLNAFLYHLNSYDPSNYQPLNQVNISPNTNVATGLIGHKVPLLGDGQSWNAPGFVPPDSIDCYELDERNRLLVPTSYFRTAQCEPGEKVKIIINPGQIILTAFPSATDSVKLEQVLERDGNVRLSYGTLCLAGFLGEKFGIQNITHEDKPAIEIFNIDDQGNRI